MTTKNFELKLVINPTDEEERSQLLAMVNVEISKNMLATYFVLSLPEHALINKHDDSPRRFAISHPGKEIEGTKLVSKEQFFQEGAYSRYLEEWLEELKVLGKIDLVKASRVKREMLIKGESRRNQVIHQSLFIYDLSYWLSIGNGSLLDMLIGRRVVYGAVHGVKPVTLSNMTRTYRLVLDVCTYWTRPAFVTKRFQAKLISGVILLVPNVCPKIKRIDRAVASAYRGQFYGD